MKAKPILLGISALAVVGIVLLAFSTVPTPDDESECLVVRGIVSNIYEGGVKDAVFSIKGEKRLFYINRGLENGLSLTKLKNDLEGKEVTIKYPDYWALLDADGSIKHITQLEHNGQIIYTEIQKGP
ncbi:hypothetical protein LRS05_00960 [Flavobacterium sp. J372]|uniref:hypothetical protein n=1 Tax=Flavobacterium sp. J372 TaxID=2898436 RepID=UPI002151D084|nr:hypothetical protein [Flavobacterium sp. J372]MCR5860805.1 hypothetical protein [Flavobacterium sp. J372]